MVSHRIGNQNLLSRAPACFGRHFKPLVPVEFAVVITHSSFKEGWRQAAGCKNNCRIFITTWCKTCSTDPILLLLKWSAVRKRLSRVLGSFYDVDTYYRTTPISHHNTYITITPVFHRVGTYHFFPFATLLIHHRSTLNVIYARN
jgi:hypothetical protein